MSEFFAMGGYAAFLWPAYAITLLAVVVNVIAARRAHAAAREEARRRLETDVDPEREVERER
ncbi:MAG: heme exporter protein CcmD [Gammaproteobacteria bacterium]|jgi:heme exporter protein D|nr:heme exporter protein CcmD [Gammaproteobacteria bacterium]NBP08351.1 heme exporter protein CcmD [Gammaproteobacteria bacterium]NCW58082.1 heme exporter protein CcmD [Gammaproteobacteria bacterium]NDA44187.1 heme exporter protein CcmD [Gammaproteobacteria bacterium]NDB25786.1 heme exporter protein CcmD [Gammaproteobacteria bacterium]